MLEKESAGVYIGKITNSHEWKEIFLDYCHHKRTSYSRGPEIQVAFPGLLRLKTFFVSDRTKCSGRSRVLGLTFARPNPLDSVARRVMKLLRIVPK